MKTKMDRYGCDFLASLKKIGIVQGPKNPELCPDALSATSLGEWCKDGLDIVPLRLNKEKTKVAELQLMKNVNKIPKIILILESPHVDEFTTNTLCCINGKCSRYTLVSPAPAQGLTGRNIKHFLPLIFGDARFDNYKVAFVNAIQYQCSLGERKNQYRKNKIFCELLALDVWKTSLGKRVSEIIFPQYDVIINCCTVGNARYCNYIKEAKVVVDILEGQKITSTKSKFKCKSRLLRMLHPYWWQFGCDKRRIWMPEDKIEPPEQDVKLHYFCEKDYAEMSSVMFSLMK